MIRKDYVKCRYYFNTLVLHASEQYYGNCSFILNVETMIYIFQSSKLFYRCLLHHMQWRFCDRDKSAKLIVFRKDNHNKGNVV